MHALRFLWAANNEESLVRRHTRNRNRGLDKILTMPTSEFVHCFRLTKQCFRSLCADLRQHTGLKGTNEINLETKVLCTLSFLATGSYQRLVGLGMHMTQRTTSRCIGQVVDAFNHPTILNKWIKFPSSPNERVLIKTDFQGKFRLPGVIGCVDCTHVAIIRPSQDEHLYFNRKGYHSLNVQVICDSKMKITNVNSKFGGATHDAFIWASSKIEAYMRELNQNREQVWLLGDSGYPQRAWLMTPILNAPSGSREAIYNERHVRARNCVERCFGLLKARWRCLLKHRTLYYTPLRAAKIVLACCVLHNMALDAHVPPPPSLPEDEDQWVNSNPPPMSSQNELLQGRAVLNSILSRL